MFEREKIQFLGNVHIGTELPLADLRAAYDIVVVATGLYGDRKLGIPGDALNHIYGAGQITRFLNDHPDEEEFLPSFGTRPIIVGNGNVAVDVLRLLVKKGEEFHGSDLSHEALTHLVSSPIEHIDVVGRSPAALAKFDTVMIKELAKLANVRFEFNDELELESIDDPLAKAKVDALLALAKSGSESDSIKRSVTFHFGWAPVRVAGIDHVAGLVLKDTQNPHRQQSIPATSIITAIGFEERPELDLCRTDLSRPGSDLPNGFLDDGLYCTGWFRRGPNGTIPDNRADAKHVADNIAQAVKAGSLALGKPGYSAIAKAIQSPTVCYEDWKRIDTAELKNAPVDRARRKFRNKVAMLGAAQSHQAGENNQ
jgi:ferredoxin--NADP+ reductase